MDIFKFQIKVFNLPRDIHYSLKEFGVIKQDKYLLCIGNVSKYENIRLMLNEFILERNLKRKNGLIPCAVRSNILYLLSQRRAKSTNN